MTLTAAPPSAELFFDTINAYQRTAALKAAIELDLFTSLADGPATAAALADRCRTSVRGTRILCDYLTLAGFLTKTGDRYAPTSDTAMFLDRRSPAYLGGTVAFLATPDLVRNFDGLAATVRRGTIDTAQNTVAPDNPIWVQFARAMLPMMAPAAEAIADLLEIDTRAPLKVLDIAAGHGAFGVAIARRHPQAQVHAVDAAGVLEVARENAARAGLDGRFHGIAGDAFSVDYGSGYHVALVTNFLHHFDAPTNVSLLRKISAALAPGGRVAVLEFVPHEDRVSPPIPAAFSMFMLAGTPAGDAYTFPELRRMLEAADFRDVRLSALQVSPEAVVIGTK